MQRGSAHPHTQCLAVQGNHTPKCPLPWAMAIPFPPQNPGRFCNSCYDVSWKATLHLALHIGLLKQISGIYPAEKFSKLDVCRDRRRLERKVFPQFDVLCSHSTLQGSCWDEQEYILWAPTPQLRAPFSITCKEREQQEESLCCSPLLCLKAFSL